MKVLVVGGAGFIGHNVAKMLEAQGHEVSIFDNFTNYGIVSRSLMTKLHIDRLEHFKGQVVHADISSTYDCMKMFTIEPDVIIHLAAYPRAKIVNENPKLGSETMVTGLINLLENAAAVGVKRFVYISSSMVYGDFDDNVSETADLKPGSVYASLKLAGEQMTKLYAKKNEFEYTVVRPSAVYGPLDVEDRVVSKFLLNAMRGETLYVHGEQERLDFSYVGDVAKGTCLAATKDEGANETFNITYGMDEYIHTAANLATILTNNGRIEVIDKNKDMPSRGSLNINKAKKLLGYNPTVNIEQGFKIYYDWLKQFYSL